MKTANDIPIFFIICKGRSGSTLLANMLDANPNIIVPLENNFIMHLYYKYYPIKSWNKSTIDNYVNDLYTLRKTRRNWTLTEEELKNNLYNNLNEETSYASVCKITHLSFHSIFPKNEIKLIGDKNPFYTLCIDQIKELYPSAKFIHLVRDPRANIRSHIIAFKTKFISFLSWKWFYYIDEVEKRKLQDPTNFLTVKYEDLVENPELKLKEICKFLSIEYNPESLNFYKTIDSKLSNLKKYKDGIHANLSKPISKDINNKWKSFFNKKQKNTINVICEKYLIQYKYTNAVKPLNAFHKMERYVGKLYYKAWLKIVKMFYKSPFWLKRLAFKLTGAVFK